MELLAGAQHGRAAELPDALVVLVAEGGGERELEDLGTDLEGQGEEAGGRDAGLDGGADGVLSGFASGLDEGGHRIVDLIV